MSRYLVLGELPEFAIGPFTASCITCGKPLPLRRIGQTGPIPLQASCPGKCREAARCKTAGRKQYETERTWRRHYGMTRADYNSMLAAQGNGCAICGADTPGAGNAHFHVDHDHDTGQVRGLLCHHCNLGIGCFVDSPERLGRAMAYLRRNAPVLSLKRPA